MDLLRRPHVTLGLAALLIVSACGGRAITGKGPEGGASPDTPGADAGASDERSPEVAPPSPDAAPGSNDAATTPDAASPSPDAASPSPDAASPSPDAASPSPDGASPSPDGGGAETAPPQPGSPYRALAVTVGRRHTCALLDDHRVKCWGSNDYGQLGLGDNMARGATAAEMGDKLPAVDLGTGRTAKAVGAGRYATCALLDDDTVKCWGYGGQTGVRVAGALVGSSGDGPGEMGDALPIVDLQGHKARRLAVGYYTACAELDDARIRCWGAADYVTSDAFVGHKLVELKGGANVLGLSDEGVSIAFTAPGPGGGGGPNVPASGALRTIAASRQEACGIVVAGGGIVCAQATTQMRDGTNVAELAITEFGNLCALRRDGRVACWAWRAGDWAGEDPGDGTRLVALGKSALALAGGASDHMCALLDGGGIKCWPWDVASPFPALGGSVPGGTFQGIDLGTHP